MQPGYQHQFIHYGELCWNIPGQVSQEEEYDHNQYIIVRTIQYLKPQILDYHSTSCISCPSLRYTLTDVVERKVLMEFIIAEYVHHQRCHKKDKRYDKEKSQICFSYAVCVFNSSEGNYSISPFLQDVVLVLREDSVDPHGPEQIGDDEDRSKETIP